MVNHVLIEKAIENIDIIELLDENNIDYKTEGKNIGQGWIGLSECLNELCGDTRYHMGINLEGKYGYCWSCGKQFSPIKIVQNVKKISYREAIDFLLKEGIIDEEDIENRILNVLFEEKMIEPLQEDAPINMPKSVKITREIINGNNVIKKFLLERNITLNDCNDFNLRIGLDNNERGRLIIPIYKRRKLVAYQTRSFYNKQRGYISKGRINNHLFRIDKIQKGSTIFIVEGFMDYLQTNKFVNKYYPNEFEVTSAFSKIITANQINEINKLKPKEVIYLFDYDAWYNYTQSQNGLLCNINFIIVPYNKDPGSMTEKEFLQVFMENEII